MIRRTLIRRLSYPVVVLGGAVVLIAVQVENAGYWKVGPAVLVAAALLVTALERIQPYVAAWNLDHADTGTDLLHLVGNVAVSQTSVLAFAAARTAWSGLGWWPSTLPLWAQVALALLVFDLGLYAVHRASHGVGWLWRLHAIHHSSRRVYWVNGQRRHLLHEVIEGSPGLIVLFLVGASAVSVATAVAIVTIHLMFQHANLEYRLGPFRHVFAVAELHRWHHQRRWQDVQGNYAAVFSIWDRLFGSALSQRGDAPADVGMDDEPSLPNDYLGQLQWPFRPSRPS